MDVTILQEESSTSLIRERYLDLIGGNVMRKRNNNNNQDENPNPGNDDNDNNLSPDNDENLSPDNNDDENLKKDKDGKVPLAKIYKSRMLPSVQEKVRTISNVEAEEISVAEKEHRREKPMYATPWWYQFLLLAKRDFVMTIRNPRVTISQLVITLILSLLVVNKTKGTITHLLKQFLEVNFVCFSKSTIFLNINNDQEGIQLRAGVLCWIIMSQGFTSEYVMDTCKKHKLK